MSMDCVDTAKLSDDEMVQKIRALKDQGNSLHRDGNYKQAARSYYNCIMYIKALSYYSTDFLGLKNSLLGLGDASAPPVNEKKDLDLETRVLICDCYNNLAACMLKGPDPKYERIVEHCDKALEMCPTNTKALFRKGLSLYSIRKYEDALQTLLEIKNSDSQVRRYIELCKSEIARQDRELASKFKNMFKS